MAFDGTRFYEYGIVPCTVVDTMGAGDSFIAGFLYGRMRGQQIGGQRALFRVKLRPVYVEVQKGVVDALLDVLRVLQVGPGGMPEGGGELGHDGPPVQEIADRLGLPYETVKKRSQRSLSRLKGG